MKLLFLDIDGCLNGHQFCKEAEFNLIDCGKVSLLNHVLRETGAHIVLSSAWRYLIHRGEMNLQGMDWLLRSHGILAGRLVGITREDTRKEVRTMDGEVISWLQQDERGVQITQWLAQAHPCGDWPCYAVVDDMDLGITAAGHPFVQTDGKVGLTEVDAERLIELLGKE